MSTTFDERNMKMLEAINAPLMVADASGAECAKNQAWRAMQDMIGKHSTQIVGAIRAAAERDGESRYTTTDFTLLVTPLGGEGEKRYLCQLLTDEKQDSLFAELARKETINTSYREKLASFGSNDYIATSDSMIRIFTKAKQVAAYPTSILILGDTGVGKEVVASFIHHHSDRVDKPFIKINCSAIPEPLMESELFGYESGAFTGARDRGKAGLFELANHGTIMLDEVGDMALPLQAKLLRVIQDSEVRRVGGSRTTPVDVRIISATSRDLESMMNEGTFLDALYYRLNVVEIQIPPLCERREDILPLAEYYLQFFCEKYKLAHNLSPEARECLLQYTWPGNVRELRNTMENLSVSALRTEIGLDELPARMTLRHESVQQPVLRVGENMSMKEAVETVQREMILHALQTVGSFRKAAALLDMDPATLQRLAKKLDIRK